MWGEIVKILAPKKSRNEGDSYFRIEFKLENGQWAKTDIVPGFRNYRRWKRIARLGNKIRNLQMKDEITVDADSFPYLVDGNLVGTGQKLKMQELFKMGVFG